MKADLSGEVGRDGALLGMDRRLVQQPAPSSPIGCVTTPWRGVTHVSLLKSGASPP
jgi:hypothetical protein